ncbi:MAG: hypothetical protein ACK45T_00205, partial [Pseudanabaena sp.]
TLKRLAQDHGLRVEVMKRSGQYSNIPFIVDRLEHYGFYHLARLFRLTAKLCALDSLNWYADTGSIFVILRKVA